MKYYQNVKGLLFLAFFMLHSAIWAQAPQAAFSVNLTSGCPNMTVTFTDTSSAGVGISSWDWDFGDGTTSALQSPSHTYANSGAHTVELTITDNAGISDVIIKPNLIKITQPPTAVFSTSSSQACVPHYPHMNNQSQTGSAGIKSWDWDFGNGLTANVKHPQNISYTTAGQYTITLAVVDSNNCYAVSSANVTVNAAPVADFSVNTTSSCAKVPLQFTDLSTSAAGVNSWFWVFGDGATANVGNPTRAYQHGGVYDLTLNAIDANGCVGTKTRTQHMTIIEAPDANFQVDKTTALYNLGVNFADISTADTTIISYAWDFGDGTFSTMPVDSHYYSKPGKYNVSLTVTNARGCEDVDSRDELIWVRVPFMPISRANNLKADEISLQDENPGTFRTANPSGIQLSEGIKVYPNPMNNGPIYIQIPKEMGGTTTFQLYDMIGKLLHVTTEEVSAGEMRWEVPLNLSAGTYHLSINSAAISYRKVLLKK